MMKIKSTRTALAFTILTGLFAATSASAMTWAEADSTCAGKLGAGCCASAGDDGNPKMRDGVLVCHCGAALPARITDDMRKEFGRDKANLKEVKVGGAKR